MAEQMQVIKRRIKSISSTERITNAMKLVSAAKLRRSKMIFERSRGFLNKIEETIGHAFENAAEVPGKYILANREINTTCFIVITSSTGLCGSFNTNVIRMAEEEIQKVDHAVKMVTIGSKGREYFERRNVDLLMTHDATADTITYQEARDLGKQMVTLYNAGEVDEYVLVYTSYINTLKQEVVAHRILPIDMSEHVPGSFKAENVEYEPSAAEVFEYLCKKLFDIKIYSATIESATCEHAARRQAMENANDNAAEMLADLQLEYNRARQSQITDEIIEIVSGSEALS